MLRPPLRIFFGKLSLLAMMSRDFLFNPFLEPRAPAFGCRLSYSHFREKIFAKEIVAYIIF